MVSLLLLLGCPAQTPPETLFSEPVPALVPPETPEIPIEIGCPQKTRPLVENGCSMVVTPGPIALRFDQELTIGEWYRRRAELCVEYRTLDRSYASDRWTETRTTLAETDRQNRALRASVVASGALGVMLGISSAALAVWLLSETVE